MNITIVPINELKHYSKNTNIHPEDQIARLADLIKAHGFRDPLTVDLDSMQVITGNGTLMACKMLGMSEVPCVMQKFDSEEQMYAFSISHNSVQEWSEIDMSQIHKDLENLQPFDLTLLGFRDFTFEPDPVIGLTDEDSVPENVVSKVKLGDLFILGNNRLLCGDSTNIQHVEMLMNGEKADMVFTDPPYKMVGGGVTVPLLNSWSDKVFKDTKKENLFETPDFSEWVPVLSQALAENCECLVMSNDRNLYNLLKAFDNSGWKHHNILIWKKNNKIKHGWYMKQYEAIFYGYIGKSTDPNIYESNVVEFDSVREEKEHISQKPIGLLEGILKNHKANNILEPFGGSGSTLIACEKTNRKCFMMELDPKYCSVIIERWKQFTGKEAFLLNEDHTQTPWSEITTPL